MVTGMSEDGGSFVSDNIVSNEVEFQHAIPALQKTTRQGAYIGVGPEQNFTYITALRPSIAFIVDIRRGNLLLHLTYKALIELSPDRVGFVSRLFARPRPARGIPREATTRELFGAFRSVSASDRYAETTLLAVLDRLERVHGFALSSDDEKAIADLYRSFCVGGPDMRGDFGGGKWIPSYAELMAQTDLRGRDHNFLESDGSFRILKEYESNNLIVPLVGDFAGDKTIRAVGQYLRDRHAIVDVFYASNVEEYLFKAGNSRRFFTNVSTLPIDRQSTFVRAFFTHTDAGLRTLLDPIGDCLKAVARGDVRTYADLIARSKAPGE